MGNISTVIMYQKFILLDIVNATDGKLNAAFFFSNDMDHK